MVVQSFGILNKILVCVKTNKHVHKSNVNK